MHSTKPTRYRALNLSRFKKTKYWERLGPELRHEVGVASTVLPFRTNEYVLEELIDWSSIPYDPIFQLTFPQREMLDPDDFEELERLLGSGASDEQVYALAREIRALMRPHPGGQVDHNVPELRGRRLEGMQHKYAETLLYFPAQARTCHAYCTFCFRWPLLVEKGEHDFEHPSLGDMLEYLEVHTEVSDVLFTGGDPMVMSAGALARHLEPLLHPRFGHVRNIRIGTKTVAYWPQRFVSDGDSDELMRLFEKVAASGRHLSVMGHYCHPVELSTATARQAAVRVRSTGAAIRIQAPLVRRINDSAEVWAELWRTGVRLGAVPYYMFVERDTGPKNYFEVPLWRALEIYKGAYKQVSGLCRTVRGPSMSTFMGKVNVVDIVEMAYRKVFALQYIQARDPDFARRLFFARFDPEATWFTQLEPAFESERPFFITQDTYEEHEAALVGA